MNNITTHGMKLFTKLLITTIICDFAFLFVTPMINSQLIRLVLQFCFLFFTASLIYGIIWKIGSVDKTIAGEKPSLNKHLTGLYIGFVSCIPFFGFSVLYILSRYGIYTSDIKGFYILVNGIFSPLLFTIMPMGLNIYEMSNADFIISLIPQLFIPICVCLVYLLGFYDINIGEMFVYKSRKNKI